MCRVLCSGLVLAIPGSCFPDTGRRLGFTENPRAKQPLKLKEGTNTSKTFSLHHQSYKWKVIHVPSWPLKTNILKNPEVDSLETRSPSSETTLLQGLGKTFNVFAFHISHSVRPNAKENIYSTEFFERSTEIKYRQAAGCCIWFCFVVLGSNPGSHMRLASALALRYTT